MLDPDPDEMNVDPQPCKQHNGFHFYLEKMPEDQTVLKVASATDAMEVSSPVMPEPVKPQVRKYLILLS
jgi:hypothetical protein